MNYSLPPLSILLLFTTSLLSTVLGADLRLDGGTEYGWDTTKWRSQVDGVMGGQSSGKLRFEGGDDNDSTVLSFSGDVILDGGGFSSVRKSNFGVLDLTPYAGIVMELERTKTHSVGDSSPTPPLGLHLQFHDTVSWYGYASAFAIPLSQTNNGGESIRVFLPLSSFDRASQMGYTNDNYQIDFSSVDGMDIYVLFQEGPFEIRVKEITAVEEVPSPPFPTPVISLTAAAEVKALIDATTRSGGKLYNYGYRELCVAVYKSMLNTFLVANSEDDGEQDYDASAPFFSDTVRGMICQGLTRAEAQSDNKVDAAWTLRHTLDSILETYGYLDPSEGSGWRPDESLNESFANRCSGVTSAEATMFNKPVVPISPVLATPATTISEEELASSQMESPSDVLSSSFKSSLSRITCIVIFATSVLFSIGL